MATMGQERSKWLWLGLASLLLFGSRRKRKHGDQPGPHVPGDHKVPDVLSLTQLRELATAVGMAQPEVGAAVAMAESGGRVRAVGDHGDSIGLWQIHVPSAPKQWANRDMLQHGGFNAQAAHSISNGGTDWTPWTTFRNGAYLKWMAKGK
jgi:hypothetical protein